MRVQLRICPEDAPHEDLVIDFDSLPRVGEAIVIETDAGEERRFYVTAIDRTIRVGQIMSPIDGYETRALVIARWRAD